MLNINSPIKESSSSHYVLKYVKFKGGVADVTKASNLFTGRIADKSKARRSARVLERYGYLKQVDGDIYKLTHSGLSLIRAFGRRNQMPPGDQD